MGFLLFNPRYKQVPLFKEHTYYETVVVKFGRCEVNKKETRDFLTKSGYNLIEEKIPVKLPEDVTSSQFSLSVLEKLSWPELKNTYKKVMGIKPKVGLSKKKIINAILKKQ